VENKCAYFAGMVQPVCMADINWRPAADDFRRVRDQLARIQRPWAKKRLVILAALKKHSVDNDQKIAAAAGVRTSVVSRLLSDWRDKGDASVIEFGRPKELNPATLTELDAALRSSSFHALGEVRNWIKAKTQMEFSTPTLRAYCKQLGFDPSAWVKPAPPKPKSVRQPRPSWTLQQITELRNCAPALQQRTKAILQVGTEAATLKEISHNCGITPKRIRKDVKLFAGGGLAAVAANVPGKNILLRIGKQKEFFDWCDSEYKRTSQCPTARAAHSYLTYGCSIPISLHGVYRHLKDWRKASSLWAQRHEKYFTNKVV
jgi:transposase